MIRSKGTKRVSPKANAWFYLLFTLSAFAFAASQTSFGSDAEKAPPKEKRREISIHANDEIKFSLATIKASPGESLRLIFKNTARKADSEVQHNLVILDREMPSDELVDATFEIASDLSLPKKLREICLGITPIIGPENSAILDLTTPTEPGNYTFFCSFPGHAFIGMRGIITIE